jgi:phospholipid-binding lipoprotein MlaA
MKAQALAIIILALITSGCATSNKAASSDLESPNSNELAGSTDDEFDEFEDEFEEQAVTVADPLEGFNRLMFGVNDALYLWIGKPVIKTYKGVVPKPSRIGIGNFFRNITTPARYVNCLLQGKGAEAGRESDRFIINTTLGVLGFGDPAKDKWGIEPAKEDLGQTLAVHGFNNGFYLVWPLFGPSTFRDSVGMVGDMFLNPIRYIDPSEISLGLSAVRITNSGSFHIGEYEAFKASSVDPYIAMREAYIQYRKGKINDEGQQSDPDSDKP